MDAPTDSQHIRVWIESKEALGIAELPPHRKLFDQAATTSASSNQTHTADATTTIKAAQCPGLPPHPNREYALSRLSKLWTCHRGKAEPHLQDGTNRLFLKKEVFQLKEEMPAMSSADIYCNAHCPNQFELKNAEKYEARCMAYSAVTTPNGPAAVTPAPARDHQPQRIRAGTTTGPVGSTPTCADGLADGHRGSPHRNQRVLAPALVPSPGVTALGLVDRVVGQPSTVRTKWGIVSRRPDRSKGFDRLVGPVSTRKLLEGSLSSGTHPVRGVVSSLFLKRPTRLAAGLGGNNKKHQRRGSRTESVCRDGLNQQSWREPKRMVGGGQHRIKRKKKRGGLRSTECKKCKPREERKERRAKCRPKTPPQQGA
ncbi:unnamed protein product [Trichogramma brassicae]|uniref:Uncharacterized protein n=1 Tax=Trichogramma brassicae TaxID=86971 RepID=A0A6H5HWI4_9HYME|nr:unnamed protein product [Trichogramma brassicae]